MPLSQAAIVPHPPLLIPSIGKDNLTLLPKTIASYGKLKKALKQNRIKNIFLISSHGQINPNAFNINEAEIFEINFEEFGDYSTKMSAKGNKEFVKDFKKKFFADRTVQFINLPKLDHGNCVPICYLCQEIPEIKVTPLYVSGLSLKEHFNFGKKLKTIIEKRKEKIAIIASGDLSHALTKKAPAGYSPKAARFDQKLIECIQNKKIGDIINLKEELIDEVRPCGLKSIVTLLGVLKGSNYEMENLTYEAPFGVGYLMMQMNILKI